VIELESPSYEQDESLFMLPGNGGDSRQDPPLPSVNIEEMKAREKADRKKAAAEYFMKRDKWVTLAGLLLVFLLILIFAGFVLVYEPNPRVSSLLYLLNSVIMLIIGYIFTKTSRR